VVGSVGEHSPECAREHEEAYTNAGNWTAREWSLTQGDGALTNVTSGTTVRRNEHVPVVERHSLAREWWRCEDCDEDFPDRVLHGCPPIAGWARWLEIERVPGKDGR
jgi:hypothetical protein